jgi:hypothetical protein
MKVLPETPFKIQLVCFFKVAYKATSGILYLFRRTFMSFKILNMYTQLNYTVVEFLGMNQPFPLKVTIIGTP